MDLILLLLIIVLFVAFIFVVAAVVDAIRFNKRIKAVMKALKDQGRI